MNIYRAQTPVEIRVQSPLFRWKSTVFSQRFMGLLCARELCRSRGVVSGRPASPAGPSPQGTQFGNGSGPSKPAQVGLRWGVHLAVKLDKQARRRMKVFTSVNIGCFCERVLELGSKYTRHIVSKTQESRSQEQRIIGRNERFDTLGKINEGNHWKP